MTKLTKNKPFPSEWLSESVRKTVGGQIVGFGPLYCESFGGSDYCRHCSRDMCTSTGKPNVCYVLEEVKLRHIPDEVIAAFGCDLETSCIRDHPYDVIRCDKWCHKLGCSFSIKDHNDNS